MRRSQHWLEHSRRFFCRAYLSSKIVIPGICSPITDVMPGPLSNYFWSLQARIEKLSIARRAITLPEVSNPQWLKPELHVRFPGGERLPHATVQGAAG